MFFTSSRSLETLTVRVDAMEARIKEMNSKIAQTCTNMADVIAYVDANMADMKDFLAEVVKKLPNPKRLEVVGTLRKTLILHFECTKTGLEYPITSHEWSKWLKIGFSLIKAGKMVIDIGAGNPIGLIHTGITAIQEIYTAYKTNEDDEFNTYITQPFLTSSEQDLLINKLRDQSFFDIFAYDSQAAGWYLIHPEKDGRVPEGETGSVTKVWSKKGHGGITETLVDVGVSVAKAVINSDGMVGVGDALLSDNGSTIVSGVSSSRGLQRPSEGKDSMEMGTSSKAMTDVSSPLSSVSPISHNSNSPAVTVTRAQAMKDTMNPTTVAMAEAKTQDVNLTAQYMQKMNDYEKRIHQLETQMTELQGNMKNMKNHPASCTCIIS
jgi:uncharacterized coiled-coil protein SlyX